MQKQLTLLISFCLNQWVFASDASFFSSLNPNCDVHFGEQLALKKDCVERTSEGACFNLAALVELGTAGAGAGAGVALAAFLKSQPTEFQKNYTQAIESMRDFHKTAMDVQKEYLNRLDEKLKKLSKGNVQSREQLVDDPNDARLLKQAEAEVSQELKELYKGSRTKTESLKTMTGEPHKGMYEWQEKLSKLFPELHKRLSGVYEKQEKLFAAFREKTISHQEFIKQKGALEAELKKVFDDAGATQKMSLKMYDHMYKNLNPQSHTLTEQTNLYQSANYAKKSERNGRIKSVRFGTVGAAVGDIAGRGINEYSAEQDIKRCQKEYGFTEKDLDYLIHQRFAFSDTKARNTSGYNCKDLLLDDPKKVFEHYNLIGDKIPPSICKLADAMSKKYNGLLLTDLQINRADCNSVETSHFKIDKDYTEKPIFEGNEGYPVLSVNEGKYTIKMPIRFDIRGFRFVKYFDENGKEDLKKSLALQDFYQKLSRSPGAGSSTTVKDLMKMVESGNSNNGDTFRKLAKALNQSYVFVENGAMICPDSYYSQSNAKSQQFLNYSLKQSQQQPKAGLNAK